MKKYNVIWIILLLITSGLAGFIFSIHQHETKPPLAQPAMRTFHEPLSFVNQLKNDPEAGKKIFMEFCSACHATQPVIDVNAPRIGDVKAWHSRQQMGMDVLLKLTIRGVGAMPSRGGCFECSDEQLRETIQYMLQESNKKASKN